MEIPTSVLHVDVDGTSLELSLKMQRWYCLVVKGTSGIILPHVSVSASRTAVFDSGSFLESLKLTWLSQGTFSSVRERNPSIQVPPRCRPRTVSSTGSLKA